MGMRSVFSGCVSFGMVSIPIKAYSAASSKAISFNMLSPDGNRVKQQLVDGETGEVVNRADTTKGYEISKGVYVSLTSAELASLAADNDKQIKVLQFVPLKQVDPMFFDKGYMLGPDNGGDHAYALLKRAMETTHQVAIGRFVSRGKENLAVIRPVPGLGLAMHTLHYHDEMRGFDDIDYTPTDVPEEELDLATQLVKNMSEEEYDASLFEDEYRGRVLGAIEQKSSGQEITAPATENKQEFSTLVASLKASLNPTS